MKKIILASTSERRKDLLESIGLKFTVVASPYEEDMTLYKDPEIMVREFSQGKARGLKEKYPNHIIIGADTIVYFDDIIFGKPRDKEDALQILSILQGKKHTVYTGYTILDSETEKEITEVVKTEVTFAPLTREEILSYYSKSSLLDKSGAYTIQNLGASFVESITGEYSNVVGIPLASIRKTLKEFGINIL